MKGTVRPVVIEIASKQQALETPFEGSNDLALQKGPNLAACMTARDHARTT
jgi:hypothetical protein